MIAFGTILLCFCALSQSLPIGNPSDSVLMDYKADSHSRFEEGTPGKSVKGSYSWINEDKVYQVDYTADEKGYQPRLTIKSVSEAEQKPLTQQESVQVSEKVEEKPVKDEIAGAIIYEFPSLMQQHIVEEEIKEEKPVNEEVAGAIIHEIPSLVQQHIVQESTSENEEEKPVKDEIAGAIIYEFPSLMQQHIVEEEIKEEKPVNEETADAIIYEIPSLVQQHIVQVPASENKEEKPVKEAFVDAIIYEIPSLVQQHSLQVPASPNEDKKGTPEKEVGTDAIVLEIPVLDVTQQDSVQVPALLNVPMKEVGDAFIFEIPHLNVPQQDDFQIPTLPDEVKKVTPGIEGGFDAIIVDIPGFDEPTPLVQKGSQASLTSQNEKIIAGVAPPSKPVTLQVNSQSESNKVADKLTTKVPDASAPVVQEQDIIQSEEVKPDQFVVVVAPAQSGLVGQQFNSQVQLLSQGEPSEADQEKVGGDEGVVILQLPSNSDVYGQEEGYSQDDTVNPQFDTSNLYNIAPLFDFQSQDPSDDEIYTDDAIIIDAAGDPFASDGNVQADEDQDWGQAESQDQASQYLNAMLQEYLNQFYSNPKQKVDSKENHRSKFEDDLIKSYNDYKQLKISTKDSSVSDYQRMLEALSNGEQQVVSYDDYQNFLRHLQIEEEDRPRSKVSDVIQDQEESNEEFRVLMDLPENYNEQLYTPKKQNSKFESGDQSHAIDETFLRELYYQLWLDAHQPAQPEPMYYAIYPESAYYYR